MKKKFLLLLSAVFLISHYSKAQFGNGSAGDVTLTGTYTYVMDDVLGISGNVITVNLGGLFAVGDQLLLIQKSGAMATTNNGNWNRLRVVSTFGPSITVALEDPTFGSTTLKPYDVGTEEVKLIKLEQYNNITIDGTLSPFLTGTGDIVCLLAKSTIHFNPGSKIDVSNHGYAPSDVGYGGLPNLATSIPGVGGLPGANGGTTGTGGLGIYGGGNGGDQGPIGGSATPPTYPAMRASGSTTIAKNASIPAAKRFVSGDGGNSGLGSNASNNGAAGGGGSDHIDFFDPTPWGASGTAGTIGNPGVIGGFGSLGGGMVFLFTNEISGAATNNQIIIKAIDALPGNTGSVGGNGGNGGEGAGRNCLHQGGGGGGGNGGNGGDGSQGGSAGAGGAVYVFRNSVAPISGIIAPISNYVNNGVALGGAGGAGGVGGTAGVSGGDENTTSVFNCGALGILPCSTAHYMDTMYTILATTGPGTYISGLMWQSGANVGFARYYSDRTDSLLINGVDLIDCNDSAYSRLSVHIKRLGVDYDFYLYSNGDAYNSVVQGFWIWGIANYWTPNTPTSMSYINDNAHMYSDQVLVHDCYAVICNPIPANPGQPGNIGSPGLDGEPGVIDEDRLTGLPFNIELITLNARLIQNKIHLYWQIPTNNSYQQFELEKSINGHSFEKIATLPATTTSYFDGNLSMENHYRLKTINNNGTFLFTNIESIQLDKVNILNVFPTVTKDEINIEIPNWRFETITIKNMSGQTVASCNVDKNKNQYKISTQKFASGIYYVHYGSETIKILKQ